MSVALVEAVRRYTGAQSGSSPFTTAIAGLTLLRAEAESDFRHLIFKPALCITLQGAKSATFGTMQLDYPAGHALLVSIAMPGRGRVTQASPARPFLGVILEFDLAIMSEVMAAMETPPGTLQTLRTGISVTNFQGPLTDCVLRLIRLLEQPRAIPVLYPAVMREVAYWLLSGPHGSEVATATLAGGHAHNIIHAIHALRTRFAETVRMDDLAAIANLSTSAFHRKFKAMTSVTPLQYQKQLRLLEARRLMLFEDANVERAAFRVGYESSSQFSREYARMFGQPPRRDVATLRDQAA